MIDSTPEGRTLRADCVQVQSKQQRLLEACRASVHHPSHERANRQRKKV
jgi:hypothetical protein